jgi:hypothetical protein
MIGFGRGARHAAQMQPETGGRFSVQLLEQSADGARFQIELATPQGAWSTQAEVSASEGAIVWSAWAGAGEPPDWLCQYTRAALRVAWRQHAEEGWPRRLTRWRDAPSPVRGGGSRAS